VSRRSSASANENAAEPNALSAQRTKTAAPKRRIYLSIPGGARAGRCMGVFGVVLFSAAANTTPPRGAWQAAVGATGAAAMSHRHHVRARR